MESRRKRVLVVDDNAAIARVIQFNLSRVELEVVVASNGRQAIDQINASPEFDLVITDHQMPQLTGAEFIAQLRNDPRYTETPVILLTAKSLETDFCQVAQELGVFCTLSKPFSPEALVKTVKQLFSTAMS